MIQNPFEVIERKLTGIENLLIELKHRPIQIQQEYTEYLDFKAALEFCKQRGIIISESKARKMCMDNVWPSRHFGGKVVFHTKELTDWIDTQTTYRSGNPVCDSVSSAAKSKVK